MKKVCLSLVCCCFYCLSCFSVAQSAPANRVVAVVNGAMITMFDLNEAARPELLRQKQANPDQVRQQVLDEMVLHRLIADEAARLQITVTDAEVEQEILNMMKVRNVSREAFAAQLAKEGLTAASLRTRVKNGLLQQRVLGKQVGRMVVVSAEEIREYYEAHRSSFMTGSGANVGVLIYPPLENAEKWAAQISSGKISFEEAVARISVGPNREQGGKMGIPDRSMPSDWRKRIAAMSPGDVSGVFLAEGRKTQIKLYGIVQGGEQISLEEATPRIDALLREPKAKERFAEYTRQLREKAVIDIRL